MSTMINSLAKPNTINPNKMLWEKGDFTQIAATMRESGVALVKQIGVKKGMEVLDLGCGNGTTAIPEALTGANVLGVDISGYLVKAGNERVKARALTNCRFQEGDASDLIQIEDHSFDLTVSIFGAMFAPNPFDVAREMVRVTRPGGKIIMGNWIPGDPTLVAQILKICSAYTPPPPQGFISPMLWGVEEHVTERFKKAGIPQEKISFSKESFTFSADYSPTRFLEIFRDYYSPTMNAYEAAQKNGKEKELHSELEVLFRRENKNPDENKTTISATYLLVTVQC